MEKEHLLLQIKNFKAEAEVTKTFEHRPKIQPSTDKVIRSLATETDRVDREWNNSNVP